MPKHRVTKEDTFKPEPCPICGNNVFDEDTETCSGECEAVWKIFEDDMLEDALREMDLDEAIDFGLDDIGNK